MNFIRRRAVIGLIAALAWLPALGLVISGSPAPDGAALYRDRCASCHEPVEQSTLRGVLPGDVRAALGSVQEMKSLSALTAAEMEAIASSLARWSAAGSTTGPASQPVRPRDGVALYQARCARCHRPIAQSKVRRASAGAIQRALGRQRRMRSLSTMTPAEVAAIADALATQRSGPASSAPAGRRTGRYGEDD